MTQVRVSALQLRRYTAALQAAAAYNDPVAEDWRVVFGHGDYLFATDHVVLAAWRVPGAFSSDTCFFAAEDLVQLGEGLRGKQRLVIDREGIRLTQSVKDDKVVRSVTPQSECRYTRAPDLAG